MDVLEAEEILILLKTVLQEPVLMVRPWIYLTQNQFLLNQTKVLATVVDVALTLPKIFLIIFFKILKTYRRKYFKKFCNQNR
jgi:hypothetical protein